MSKNMNLFLTLRLCLNVWANGIGISYKHISSLELRGSSHKFMHPFLTYQYHFEIKLKWSSPNLFVKILANCNCDGTNSRMILPFSTWFLIKWCMSSMCVSSWVLNWAFTDIYYSHIVTLNRYLLKVNPKVL